MPEVYSAREVARAAGVEAGRVRDLVKSGQIPTVCGFVPQGPAVRLVRRLLGRADADVGDRSPLTLVVERPRRGGLALASTTGLHATLLLALILIPALGWLNANDTEAVVERDEPLRLVFLMSPGPGGGGGGGGMRMPAPPPPAERQQPEPERIPSPVPPPRPRPAPPRLPRPRRPPIVVEPRPEPPDLDALAVQGIQAPVVPQAAGHIDRLGLPTLNTPSLTDSFGPGTGGGIGSGQGLGLGAGLEGGIGPGYGGGTGGGPYGPGSGIEPPTLVREVRPDYTTEARRQAIEGDVVLEIVVRADGRVGNVDVVRSLGAGLSQKAIEAVKQWRFTPARRYGSPVDVVVTVSVEFSLR